MAAAHRQGVLGPLYSAASAQGLTTLADKGYVGAAIGVAVPTKGRDLTADTRCRNQSACYASADACWVSGVVS